MPLPHNRRAAYNPVPSSTEEADEARNENPNNVARSTQQRQSSFDSRNALMESVSKEDTPLNSKALLDDDEENDDDDIAADMTVIILDSAQKKFPIPCNKSWTIGTFKRKSSKIHKVPSAQQRLIFRGKMLQNDTQTLEQVKITENNVIVHLFPKPRVVVTSSDAAGGIASSNSNENHDSSSDADGSAGGGGAHIPSIVIDQDEQERRGQILVLGSVEIAESQNNVKMLSLLLLVICSMRLLALLSIAMGVAEEPASGHDIHNSTHAPTSNDNSPYNTDPNMEPRDWRMSDYFDLAVSATGFYVATLGMKATQENTLRIANAYLIGTILAGIGWNAWNVFMYVMFYEQETAPSDDDDLPPLTRDDFITVAFFTVAMPFFVWGVCCARAWEFRRLIGEAEEEAAERIRSQLTMTVDAVGNDGENDDVGIGNHSRRNERELMDFSVSRTEIV
jgi:hypothetical protein